MSQTDQLPLMPRAERAHLVVGVLAAVVSLVAAPQPVWVGVLTGVLLGAGNLHLLGLIVERMVSGVTQTKQAAVGWLVFKLVVLGLAIGGIMRWLHPHPIALLGGITLSPLVLVVEILRTRPRLAPPEVS